MKNHRTVPRLPVGVLTAWCLGASLGYGAPPNEAPAGESTAHTSPLEPTPPLHAPAVAGPMAAGEAAGPPSAYGNATEIAMPVAAASPSGPDVKVLSINLPTALTLANAANPTIAAAQARVQQAYARLREADVLWVPNLLTGPAALRHDGIFQNSRGDLFITSKWNFFIGGQAQVAVETSDALFGPLIARRLVDAQAAAARATTYSIQLDVALTYLDLLQDYAALAINEDTLRRAREMLRSAAAAQRSGLSKTAADENRARTEVALREQERIGLEAQTPIASARLAQLLLLEPTVDLQPTDPAVLPITLAPADTNIDELVATGLMNRPELAESRSLVAAALERWRQSRVGPLFPRLEANYGSGYFGGGRNDDTQLFRGRADGTAQATWELHGFGFGDMARAQLRRAEYSEANFRQVEAQAQVAAEVTAAAKIARARVRSLDSAQVAVQQAELMWRKLRAVAFGMGLPARQYDPLEPLLAEQALNQARVAYLNEVVEYNRAQFRLYWAMGQPPLCALPGAGAAPLEVPVVPIRQSTPAGGAREPGEMLPGPRPVGAGP